MANLSVITGNSSGGVKRVRRYTFTDAQLSTNVKSFSGSNTVSITTVDDVNKTSLNLLNGSSNGSNGGCYGIYLGSDSSVQYIMNQGDSALRDLSFEVIEYN